MTEATDLRVPATYTNALLRVFGAVLRESGAPIDLAALEQGSAGGQTQIDTLFALIDVLNDEVGVEWPVQASMVWRNQMHGTVDVAARSAETLADALDIFARYGKVRGPFLKITKVARDDRITLINRPAVPIAEGVWQALGEFVLLSTVAILRQITDAQMDGITVDMPDRAYEHRQMLQEALGMPVRFGGEDYVLHCAAETAAMPLPFHDPVLLENSLAQLRKEAAGLSRHDWIVEDVRRILLASSGERPDAQSVARQLGLSQRSLVRKLAANDTSFRALLDAHLQERAAQLLGQGDLSLEQIAEELGYRDRTSFSRARRRWRG